jgi:hypothetical protein
MGAWIYRSIFLTTTLVGEEWSVSRPGHYTPRERALGTHWIGGWLDPKTGLNDIEKFKFLTLPVLEHRPLSRPACRQSLCLAMLAITDYAFL